MTRIFAVGDGYPFSDEQWHVIPEFESIGAAERRLEEVLQSRNTESRHIQADDTVCALALFLSRGTQHEDAVGRILEAYYKTDKWFS